MKVKHNSSRVEALSDAVFAFAGTLMIFNIDTSQSFTYLMENDWKAILAFGVSFFVLIMLWKVHYNFFRRTNYIDNWIIALNSILLFLVLYYIFPLKSLINSWLGKESITIEELGSLFSLYSLGFVLIFATLSLMYLRAYRKTRSIDGSLKLLFYSRHFGIFVLVSILSVILAITGTLVRFGVPGFVYAFLGPLCYFHAVYFDRVYKNALS